MKTDNNAEGAGNSPTRFGFEPKEQTITERLQEEMEEKYMKERNHVLACLNHTELNELVAHTVQECLREVGEVVEDRLKKHQHLYGQYEVESDKHTIQSLQTLLTKLQDIGHVKEL